MTEDGMITPAYSDYSTREIIRKLAEYEDLDDQGLLWKLHCKVGDTVYYTDENLGYVCPVKISQIMYFDLWNGIQCRQYGGCFHDCNGDFQKVFYFFDENFGKDVFLTQSEADEKLEELKRGENNA